MEFWDLLEKRRSVRSYSGRQIPDSWLEKIISAALSSPSAGNRQSYKIAVVRDSRTKEALYQASLGQESLLSAPLLLVFFADENQCSAKYGERGANLYCVQDATIAAAYAQLAAADLGLGSVWIGAFEAGKVAEILKAQKGETPVAIIPLGYPAENPARHKSRQKSEIVREIL